MDEKNLMQEMREQFYPYDKQTQNLTEALEFIKGGGKTPYFSGGMKADHFLL